MTGGNNTPTQAYGEEWYWDNRYAEDPSTFDWYQKYPSLAPLIRLYAPPQPHHPILVVGCGNSAFSEGMVEDGYDEVVNIDISSVVIDAMQNKYSNCPQLKCIFDKLIQQMNLSCVSVFKLDDTVAIPGCTHYTKMDVRDMSAFNSSFFSAIIDKGTLDSLLCGHNSCQSAAKMLEEVWRVLKDNGVYILITYGLPVYRLPLLKALPWTTRLHVIEKLPSGSDPHQTSDLTSAIPLDENGSSEEIVARVKADVHYVYICLKDNARRIEA